jgi:hypothetical protein
VLPVDGLLQDKEEKNAAQEEERYRQGKSLLVGNLREEMNKYIAEQGACGKTDEVDKDIFLLLIRYGKEKKAEKGKQADQKYTYQGIENNCRIHGRRILSSNH